MHLLIVRVYIYIHTHVKYINIYIKRDENMCMYAYMKHYIVCGATREFVQNIYEIYIYIYIVFSIPYASTLDLDFISKVPVRNRIADRIKKKEKTQSVSLNVHTNDLYEEWIRIISGA